MANLVRTIDGIPTTKAKEIAATPEASVSQESRTSPPSLGRNRVTLEIINSARPRPVKNRGIPTCTSIARANIAINISTRLAPRSGNVANPWLPSTTQIAPTTPAMPMPAVKNSNISSARPIINNRYVTGGLAEVCSKRSTNPSLKNLVVAASRTSCPFASLASTTVCSVLPLIVNPSSASSMFRNTGTPSSAVVSFNAPSFFAC